MHQEPLGRIECMRFGLLRSMIVVICHVRKHSKRIEVLLAVGTLGDLRSIVLDRKP